MPQCAKASALLSQGDPRRAEQDYAGELFSAADRLLDEVGGPAFHGLHRDRDIAVAGDHDGGWRRASCSRRSRIESVHVRRDVITSPQGRQERLAGGTIRDAYRFSLARGCGQPHCWADPRQCQVMEIVLAGDPSKDIAADLGISQRGREPSGRDYDEDGGTRSPPALAPLALAPAVNDGHEVSRPFPALSLMLLWVASVRPASDQAASVVAKIVAKEIPS